MEPRLPARSTAEAVSSGVVYAVTGGVNLLISQYTKLLDDTPVLLLTGGDSPLIAEHLTCTFKTVTNLTLTGLEVIAYSQ